MKLPRNAFFKDVSFNMNGYSYSGMTASTNADYIVMVGSFKAGQEPRLRAIGTLRGTFNNQEYAGRYCVISLLKNGHVNFKIA